MKKKFNFLSYDFYINNASTKVFTPLNLHLDNRTALYQHQISVSIQENITLNALNDIFYSIHTFLIKAEVS